MKAVIYARYSSDNQTEASIEGQLRECMEYANHTGITVVASYIDRALSAKTDNRPEFQRMIKDSYKQLFDAIIVWKLDRFARNRYDSAHYKNILKKNGVKVISAKETISEGSEGILLESILEGYAEYYSAELSEKVIRGLTENALKCKVNGGQVPFGYIINAEQKLEPDKTTAPILEEIFKMYADGKRIKEIVDYLNAKQIRTKFDRPMSINIVQYMLSNRKYMGEFRYWDITIPDGIPDLVDKSLFEAVQEQLQKNKKAPARHKAEGRLSFDDTPVLRKMRGVYGRRKRNEPKQGSPPVLQMRKGKETRLRQENRQKRMDRRFCGAESVGNLKR